MEKVSNEKVIQETANTWKKILTFVVKLIELVIATFFGATAANLLN